MSLFGQTAVQATKAAKDHNNSKTDHNGEPLYFYDKTIDYDAANDFNLTSVNITHTEMNAMRNGALNRALEAINLVLGRNGVAQPVTFNDFEATTYARIIANETNGDVGYVLFPVDMFCVKDGYRCEINIDHPTYANTTWGAGSEVNINGFRTLQDTKAMIQFLRSHLMLAIPFHQKQPEVKRQQN